MERFTLDVSYGQVCVFDAELEEPFNDWSEAHLRQGFAWRPGSVSFATLETSGAIAVQVARRASHGSDASTALRIIEVPFAIPAHGRLEVASIASGTTLQLQSGACQLLLEHGRHPSGLMWASFYFNRVDGPVAPRILRADPALSPPETLLMTARPA